MLKVSWICVILVLYLASMVSSEISYAVTGPEVMQPGTPYLLSITTQAENISVVYNLTVSITNTANSENLVQNTYELNTGESYTLTLNIPQSVPHGSYRLYANAENGLNFMESHTVSMSSKVHSLIIQTDKKLYKPGQTCKFRVIALKSDLKAFKEDVNITIFDTALNKIKKLVNKNNNYGVIKGDLELSNVTPLGQWKITAETKYAKKDTYFQVAEYVLPKFEVKVDTPSHFFVYKNNPSIQENHLFSIIAKYTYGKPLQGSASVTITHKSLYFSNHEPYRAIRKILELKDGKADVSLSTLDLEQLLYSRMDIIHSTFFIDANVTETITGLVLGANNTFKCKPHRLEISFLPSSPNNYKPGLSYKADLGLKSVDGTPVDLSELPDTQGSFGSLSLIITARYPSNRHNYYNKKDVFLSYNSPMRYIHRRMQFQLDRNGQASFEFETTRNAENFHIEARYFDPVSNMSLTAEKSIVRFKTRYDGGIQLTIKNSSHFIKPGDVAHFNCKTVHSVDKIFFKIMAKGLFILSKVIKSSSFTTSHDFDIHFNDSLTLKIAPQVRFLVFYITPRGEIIADSLSLSVENYFINKISLAFSKNQTSPGDESVTLDVDTTVNSYVGLLGVDQSVLLLDAGNDITQEVVSSELTENAKRSNRRFKRLFPRGTETYTLLDNAGLFVLTNLHIEHTEQEIYFSSLPGMGGMGSSSNRFMGSSCPGGRMPPPRRQQTQPTHEVASTDNADPVSIRTNFPETLIWTDFITDSQGKVKHEVIVPDTITSWVVTGFSINDDLGLGISETPAKLTVLKPFFISLNLPYSIIRGEEFALQVTVFNYYGQDIETDIKLSASEYFQVIKCETKEPQNSNAIKRVEVENNKSVAVYFWIVATSLGQIPIEVTALAGVAADAMRVKLLVKPEGQAASYSTSEFIQLQGGDVHTKEFEVKLPESGVVSGSIHVAMTLVGDVIGSSLNGIEDLLQMPYGCGEQNLLSFAPDVFILNYLTVSSQLTFPIYDKALNFINTGYQTQLTFQRDDGSFSAFGQKDSAGSTWLSAFTIKCFHQAREFISLDDTKIARTLSWIINNQAEDGSFHEPPGGKVLHTNMQGGSSSKMAMTAYVLISLLENKENTEIGAVKLQISITKATSLLERSISEYSSNSYVLAIISYALYKANSIQLPTVLTHLDNLAISNGGLKYWNSRPGTPSSQRMSLQEKPKSYNIELASYVLMVYSQKSDLSNSLPIAKWLLSQRNANGGFASTQDTVLALEALSWFASLVVPQSGGQGVVVKLTTGSGTILHTFDQVTRANSLILQSFELPENITAVSVVTSGDGVVLVQLNVHYNIDVEDKSQFLNLNLNTESNRNELTLDILTSWNGEEVSGMVLVEVNILSGFSLREEGSLKRQIGESFKKLEKSHNKIVIYLDELTDREISITLNFKETLAVSNVKPALVKVYRYYDKDSVASGFYSSTHGQSWEGACPLCCPAVSTGL